MIYPPRMRAVGKLSQRAADDMNLQDEIQARIEAMRATGDIDPSDYLRTALDDIMALDAEDTSAHTTAEYVHWRAIRRAARRMRKRIGA